MVQRISHVTSTSVTSARQKTCSGWYPRSGPYHPRLRGAPEGLPFLFDVQTLTNGMNFTLATDLGDIDLLGHLSGLGEFPAVALDAISMPLFGGECRVASLDSLILSKRAAGRSKDLNVLPELEALKEMHAPKEQIEPPQD
jgi:hypothetical protein